MSLYLPRPVVCALLLMSFSEGAEVVAQTADFSAALYRELWWNRSQDVVVGDVTGDGLNDIVVAAPSSDSTRKKLLVYAQQADHSIPDVGLGVDGPAYPYSLDLGDLNGDGRVDVVVGGMTGEIRVILQGTSGQLTEPAVPYLLAPASPETALTPRIGTLLYRKVKVGDVNGDGRADVVCLTYQERQISVYLQNASGGMDGAVHYDLAHIGNKLAIEDFDGDGRRDVILHNPVSDTHGIAIMLQNGSGTLNAPVYHNVGQNYDFCAADMNGDGRTDLVLTRGNSFSSTVTVVAQNASGGLEAGENYSMTRGPGPVAAGDVNGDGFQDVLAIAAGGELSVFMQNASRRLSAEQRFTTPRDYRRFDPRKIVLGDLNGDGAPDMTTCEGDVIVQVRYNHSAVPCTAALTPVNVELVWEPRSPWVAVATGLNCPWTAVSNAPWLTVTSEASGTGSARVYYSAAANPSVESRTGTITVGGKTHTVTQGGQPCPLSHTPQERAITSEGGSATIAVTAAADCTWTAASTVPWLTITSGASGSGNGTVTYVAEASTSLSERTGKITFGGQWHTVIQLRAPCPGSVAPAGQSMPAEGGAGTVAVSSWDNCSWAASSSASWLTITSGAEGSGNATVSYTVARNSGSAIRSGWISFGTLRHTVTQSGFVVPGSSVNPTQHVSVRSGGEGYQELFYNYTAGALDKSRYESAPARLQYTVPRGQWVGIYHYDYAAGRFSQALYSTNAGL